MLDLDALVAGVLVRQMVQLLLEWRRVKSQVDNGVNAVGHTDAVSREFRRFQIVGADARKGGLGVGGFLKKSVESGEIYIVINAMVKGYFL